MVLIHSSSLLRYLRADSLDFRKCPITSIIAFARWLGGGERPRCQPRPSAARKLRPKPSALASESPPLFVQWQDHGQSIAGSVPTKLGIRSGGKPYTHNPACEPPVPIRVLSSRLRRVRWRAQQRKSVGLGPVPLRMANEASLVDQCTHMESVGRYSSSLVCVRGL